MPCWRINGDACTLPMSICRGKRIGLTCYPMAALQSSTIKPANHPAASRWRRAIPCNWAFRSEEHTSELQSLMRISYAVFCLQKKMKKSDDHPAVLRTLQQ